MRSCLIDGEVVCCDERGVAAFHVLRRRRNEPEAFLYAFDLLELEGLDMRRELIETRKATLASILRKSLPGVRLNDHIAPPKGALVFQHACKLGAEGIVSKRLGSRYRSGRSPDCRGGGNRAQPIRWRRLDCRYHGRFRASATVLTQRKQHTRRQWEHALMLARARVSDGLPVISARS